MEGRNVSHYRILARLGGGGMGVVYKAEDTRLKRTVALKFLPPELTRDDDARQRFIQEAQSASALDHPNICTMYEVDSFAMEGASETQLFIAMANYEGETLKDRLAHGRLDVREAVDLGLQIARGLDHAHHARIIHRDIKPANVMVTAQGLVKIVDFGIAKLVDQTGSTRTGTTLGTVAYMAPEQITGGAMDHRGDIWALGVVLYEMLTGERPFKGDTELAVIHNILNATPVDAATLRPEIPSELAAVVRRALTKSVGERYASAADVIRDLSACQSSMTAPVTVVRESPRRRMSSAKLALVTAVAIVLIGTPAFWWMQRRAQSRELEQAVAEVEALADADNYFAAFARLGEVERVAPEDERLPALRDRTSVQSSLVTEPPGATVSIKDYRTLDADWTVVGETPMPAARLPRGILRWRLELDGHDAQEFISPAPGMSPAGGGPGGRAIQMVQRGTVPEGMVWIRRPILGLTLAGYDYTKQFPGPDFLIDRYEVTNRQFKTFVAANGYAKPEFWKHPFVKDGRTLTFEQAMAEFRDRTGRPGPATWEVGSYPEAKDDYPVGGVSWYKAAAFAEFSGKSLPSVYHWSAAATVSAAAFITPASNINGKEPAPVGTFKAVTGTGLFDMAGNVREWCANQVADGSARYHLGGSWADPTYMFTYGDARDPFDRAETNGFRLVKYLDGPMPPSVLAPIRPPVREGARTPPPPEIVEAYATLYRYDPVPLESKVESRDDGNDQWVTEVVTYTTPDGKERWPAYLFLPKNARPPYQAAVIAPNSGVIRSTPLATMIVTPWLANFSYIMQSGRAAIMPVYSGTNERNTWQTSPWPDSTRQAAFIDWMVDVTLDARRAVDYLQTRNDIDTTRIALVGQSWGALFASRILAFDERFKAAVLLDGGAGSSTQLPGYASIDALNFASRARQPVLMVNGSEDFILPIESAQKPLFEQFSAPAADKRHVILSGGHNIIGQQRNQVVRETLNWLDKYLGPVSR